MATTDFHEDYLGRDLTTPGTDSRDHVGRATTATVDYLGRALTVGTWAISTAYAVGDSVQLSGGAELVAIVAGTSNATAEPAAPGSVGGTVVDGTVTWERTE